MRILNLIQLVLCLFATGWLTTAAYSGWKAGPPPGQAQHSSGGYYYGGTHYYGGSTYSGSSYSGGSRSSGGSWGGGK
jgi:hypothetical protein